MRFIKSLFNQQVDSYLAYKRRPANEQHGAKREKLRKAWHDLIDPKHQTSLVTTHPPCSCTTDPKQKERLAQMEPMLANAYHNLICGRLTGLPEDILLNIMQRLKPRDLHHLRHTARIFLRLYESCCFSPFALSPPDNSPCPWAVPRFYTDFFLRQKLRAPGGRPDLYGLCDACRKVHTRRRASWHRKRLFHSHIYCCMCCAFHPRALFSAEERSHTRSRSRVCLAHQGFVRLCTHKSVNILEISVAVQSALNQAAEHDTRDSRSIETVTVPLTVCDDASHRRSAAHHADLDPQQSAPKMDVVVDIRKLRVSIVHSWTGHLAFASSSSPEFPPPDATHATLQRRIEQELRSDAAEHIVPRLTGRRLLEMHCVDPVRCDCLAMPGREHLPHGWRLPSDPVGYQPMRCRTGAAAGLWAGKVQTREENHNGEPGERPVWPSHRAVYTRSNREADGRAVLSVDMQCCGTQQPACIQVRYTARTDVMDLEYRRKGGLGRGDMLPTWYLVMDPISSRIYKDKLGLGITWCYDPQCRLYTNSLQHPIMSMANMHWTPDPFYARLGTLYRVNPGTRTVGL